MSKLLNCVCGGPSIVSENKAKSSRGDYYSEYFVECILCLRSFSACASSDSLLEIDVARTLVTNSWNSFQERINENTRD